MSLTIEDNDLAEQPESTNRIETVLSDPMSETTEGIGEFDELRRNVRGWCTPTIPRDWREQQRGADHHQYIEFQRWWRDRLAEAGYFIPHWPRASGGVEIPIRSVHRIVPGDQTPARRRSVARRDQSGSSRQRGGCRRLCGGFGVAAQACDRRRHSEGLRVRRSGEDLRRLAAESRRRCRVSRDRPEHASE